MSKWIERVVIAVILVILAVSCLGAYTTWRDCTEAGGMIVRGMFGLECIKP